MAVLAPPTVVDELVRVSALALWEAVPQAFRASIMPIPRQGRVKFFLNVFFFIMTSFRVFVFFVSAKRIQKEAETKMKKRRESVKSL